MQFTLETNILNPDLFPQQKGPPHTLFELWRNEDPVHWNPVNPDYVPGYQGSRMDYGFWVLTRYEDVKAVSMDQEKFSSHEQGFIIWDMTPERLKHQQASFMGMPPTEHMRVRRLLMPPFMPKALRELAPKLDQLAEEIVGAISNKDGCEFVFDVASKMPVYTFCELMGIPEHYRDIVADFGNEMADVEGRNSLSHNPLIQLTAISEELSEKKRAEPDDSLISVMVNDKELNLDQHSINEFFIIFAIAGHETTRSTAAHFIYLMSKFPDQFELLKSDVDAHIDNAIEEVLRFTSTTTQFRRTALIDTEIGGHPVKKGDKIYMSYAAANRDPEIFPDPHRFDITRPNASKHLAFGIGPHVCIGARLARMELRALLKQIVLQLPDIHVSQEPRWLRSIWFNAILNLPVSYTPQSS